MDWIIILALLIIYISFSEENKKIIKILKKSERRNQEGKGMSIVIQGLKNNKCKIITDEALTLVGSISITGIVMDSDEEWIKLEYIDENKEKNIAVFRIDSIDTILLVD
ncbi:hypothetical protein CL176_09805 [Suicoccus acidiformans]|uniref:Uncharacterized protein n=1 Tax=Suicoccus acidiformans TaxID=2036206 RepID=A0A347WMF9_9LACT|nr:hypothetical protein [Suicoccus acidiformans]AXY26266.1 hypothetical protein CL176_09805 [Suicoccus acidiformans]